MALLCCCFNQPSLSGLADVEVGREVKVIVAELEAMATAVAAVAVREEVEREMEVGVDLEVGVQMKVTVTENGCRSGCYETLDIIRYVSRYHQAQPHRYPRLNVVDYDMSLSYNYI